jgi:hypothetical protein
MFHMIIVIDQMKNVLILVMGHDVNVKKKVSGRSCMCVLEVSIFQLATTFILDFEKFPTEW